MGFLFFLKNYKHEKKCEDVKNWIVLFKTKNFYSTLLIAIILFSFHNTALADNINNQTLAEIRATLNISSNISDEMLRTALNREIAPGKSEGEQIYALMSQLQLGLQLKNGSYYTRYQSYSNNVLDRNLNIWGYWKDLGLSGSISAVANYFGSHMDTTVGVFFKVQKVFEISDLWTAVLTAHNDQYLPYYIDDRQNGVSDAEAWAFVEPGIVSANKENVHDYFISAWEAYHLADNYTSLISNLRKRVYTLIAIEFPPTLVISQTPLSGPPGTSFSQSGTGFIGDSTVTLHFRKPDGTEYPTQRVNTNSSGNFSITYTAPLNKEPGIYTWWAVDDLTSVVSNQISYEITTPSFNPYIEQSPIIRRLGK